MKFIKKFLAISLILSMMQTNVILAASKYSDVAQNHWAYSSIVSIAEKGYMVGNISGEYKPDSPLDKFETSKILAMVAGYKYSGITAEESTAYAGAYNNYKPILDIYKATYAKWSSNTDKEISYLLKSGVYDTNDLDLFVLKSGEKENLRALSRQEAAAYLVRLMGRKAQALAYTQYSVFADDAKISPDYKPYVYYLRSLGIISGESNNNFNPNGAVTRAAFAVMLDKTIQLGINVESIVQPAASSTAATTSSQTNTAATQNTSSTHIDTIYGTIEKVHTSLNALQIKYVSGEIKIHKLDDSVGIAVNEQIKTINDLQEGMTVSVLLKNGVAFEVRAQSVNTTQSASSQTTASSQTATTTAQTPTTTQPVIIEYRTLRGTITDVKIESDSKTVTIEVRIINPLGGIIVERETFKVENDCKIARNSKAIDLHTVNVNDVVKATVYAGKAYELELEEKNRRMNVVVIDKKTEPTLGTNFYVVEDEKGEVYDLVVSDTSDLIRKGIGKVNFNGIRIGDHLDLTAEYAVIKEAYAYGEQGYTEGVISEISLAKNNSYIMLIDAENKAVKYHIINGAFDIYSLRLNSKVRLRLDSKEVESVSILEESLYDYYTGYIDTMDSRYIILRNNQNTAESTIKVYYDSHTIVTDSVTGQKSSLNALYRNMKVHVMFNNSANGVAGAITILTK